MADPDASEQQQLAARFPELEVEACIGRGGMGVVYRVRQMFAVSMLRWSITRYPSQAAVFRESSTLWQREYRPGGWFQVFGWLPAPAGLVAVTMVAMRATENRIARAVMWTLVVGAAAVVLEALVPHFALAESDTLVPPLGWFVLCCAAPALEALDRRARIEPALAARLDAPRWRVGLPLAPLAFALLVAAAASFEA